MHVIVLALMLAPAQQASIDRIVRYVMGDNHILGLSLAVVRDNRVVYMRGYGFADRRRTIVTTPATIFAIASLEKSFIAATILRLVERGRLRLDDRLSTFVPWYAVAKDVTVSELLTHTSGIPDYAQLPGFDRSARNPVSPTALVRRIATLPLAFPPGTSSNYSNTDYVLLGMIVERVTHAPLAAWLRHDLFMSLGLHATARWEPILPEAQRAEGSVAPGSPTLAFAAAELESNAQDLARWLIALFTLHVVNATDFARMTRPAHLADGTSVQYGMGFYAGTIDGNEGAWHSGYIEGYSSFIALVPSRQLGVVLLSNADRVDLGPLAESVLDDSLQR